MSSRIESCWFELSWAMGLKDKMPMVELSRIEQSWVEVVLSWVGVVLSWVGVVLSWFSELRWLKLSFELRWFDLSWIESNWVELSWYELSWFEFSHHFYSYWYIALTIIHSLITKSMYYDITSPLRRGRKPVELWIKLNSRSSSIEFPCEVANLV